MNIDIAGPAIARIHADARALFARTDELAPGIVVPRVTLDLPATEPEPHHVFVWGTARDFGVIGSLTGSVVQVSFHIWMTVVATASRAEKAAETANAYQALAIQIPLCDKTLGKTVDEIGLPQVKESDSWVDADGRRHAGYLLDFEAAVTISESPIAMQIIKEYNHE